MGLDVNIPGAERFYELAVTAAFTSVWDLLKASVPKGEQKKQIPNLASANILEVQLEIPGADVTISDPKTGKSITHAAAAAYPRRLMGPESADKLLSAAGPTNVIAVVRFLDDHLPA